MLLRGLSCFDRIYSIFFLKSKYGTDPFSFKGIALGLQKLLPNVNGLFQIYTTMLARYERSKDIENLIKNTPQDLTSNKNYENKEINFEKLELKECFQYQYPSSKKLIIKKLNISIKKGESIGIIGTLVLENQQ